MQTTYEQIQKCEQVYLSLFSLNFFQSSSNLCTKHFSASTQTAKEKKAQGQHYFCSPEIEF